MLQVALSLDTWTWKAEAYAASQRMPTLQICCGEPRSTSSHCGSLAALDPRLPGLPSVAAVVPVSASASVGSSVAVTASAAPSVGVSGSGVSSGWGQCWGARFQG